MSQARLAGWSAASRWPPAGLSSRRLEPPFGKNLLGKPAFLGRWPAFRAGETKVGDSRLQALAALGAAAQLAGAAAQTAMSGAMGGIKVSVSLGHDQSSSASTQASSTAVGSQLKAGGNLAIAVTGAGQDSSLTATGSELTAVGKTSLKADGAVTLQASQSVVTQHTTNSSSSESLGVGFAFGGSQEGFTIDASAGLAKGHGDGTAVSNTNTHVSGASVDIVSGGDTTLKGAVVSGNLVTATIGGNLAVQSVQDTTTYNAKQQSAGASISLCIPPICYGASTGSASFSDAKISGNFASTASVIERGLLLGRRHCECLVSGAESYGPTDSCGSPAGQATCHKQSFSRQAQPTCVQVD
ncbi:MAG: hemagglutinin repeat-containing protein [Vitreoscilla sp.]